MRVTSSMYYDSIYSQSNSKLTQNLFDVNKQISSGLKIQYAGDDIRTFTETMRLDNEITSLSQIKKSTENGYKVSNQTDTIMNEFSTLMNRLRTLMLQGANDTQDETSRDAIAAEMRGIEKNLRGLANSSINGKFLFSGSATDVKPIDENGMYQGNDQALNSLIGSNNKQQINLSGAELFLGQSSMVKRQITTNVVNSNLLRSYPNLQVTGQGDDQLLSASSTMRQLMGDVDATVDNTTGKYFFYMRGVKSDGTAFNNKVVFKESDKVSNLLDEIGKQFGNTGNVDVVHVSLNDKGQIVVEDKQKGSSKIDFHIVGAVDFSGGNGADVSDIDNLDGGTTDFDAVVATPGLFVKEFLKSGFNPTNGAATNIEGLVYDRAEFSVDSVNITSNVAQVVKLDNSLAKSNTKLSEVFDLSQGTPGTLDGTSLTLSGKDVSGNSYSATIDLKSTANGGSTFTIGGNTYSIFNMDPNTRSATDADAVTYQQLMDVVNMVVTNTLPAGNTDADYDAAIEHSKVQGETYLSYDGKLSFKDLTTGTTKATISLYDSNSDSFAAVGSTGSATAAVASFNANNSLMVRDPKNDFFKSIDEIITSMEEYKNYPDASSYSKRTIGIQNAIARLDDLQSHVRRMHSKVGAQSNTLRDSLQRTTILETSTVTLRSSIIDTDLAEASLTLQQLTLNYQAMLSTVGRVSKLSLVNYL
ncbi:MAG: flagellar biosynthesis protein FlgL [Epsilonproteobacteria bacterium]|nr:flagellar biosynthesis protein FlgL [Campylobacterota bacterium]